MDTHFDGRRTKPEISCYGRVDRVAHDRLGWCKFSFRMLEWSHVLAGHMYLDANVGCGNAFGPFFWLRCLVVSGNDRLGRRRCCWIYGHLCSIHPRYELVEFADGGLRAGGSCKPIVLV